ncbi:MAG: hypothetical protein GF349_02855 [Candidatus Magasanikbacteria bacterium]|nr:hypothetical protein [Candidatus Magasanikbacteria bacterium]
MEEWRERDAKFARKIWEGGKGAQMDAWRKVTSDHHGSLPDELPEEE